MWPWYLGMTWAWYSLLMYVTLGILWWCGHGNAYWGMWISSHVHGDAMDFLMLWTCLDVDLHGLMSCWSCGKLVLPATYLTIFLHFDFLSWWVFYGQVLLMFMLGMSSLILFIHEVMISWEGIHGEISFGTPAGWFRLVILVWLVKVDLWLHWWLLTLCWYVYAMTSHVGWFYVVS